jgi:hypothetical protein
MTTEQSDAPMTEEIRGFATKLQQWAGTLDQDEREMLVAILARAAGRETEDVDGYVYYGVFQYLDDSVGGSIRNAG